MSANITKGSVLGSPSSEVLSYRSPTPSKSPSGVHRPFDRRFQSRLSSSSLSIPRAASPAYLGQHSRQSSLASIAFPNVSELDDTSAPWDVIRWTKLRKISGQAFSELGKRNFGRPTCIAISTSILIGTSKGIILVFDYQQNHKGIIGPGTQAVECGPITSLAVSADHSTIAAGHSSGHVFTWEIARAGRPFLQMNPVEHEQAQARRFDGHVPGAAVLHLGFLGSRRTALVSADERGMAFSHLATRGLGAVGRTVKTTRILGRYPDILTRVSKARKPSSVLAFSPLPLGNVEQASDAVGLVAMMTPYLLVLVSTTPIAQTQHKASRPKEIRAHGAMSAALAWFPAIKLKGKDSEISKTKLAYCWSNVLSILEVHEKEPSEPLEKEKLTEFEFVNKARWTADEAIVAVQWLSRSVLAILTITQQLLILEDQNLKVTDSFDLLPKHIYHNDLFSQQLQAAVEHLDEEDTSLHGVVADAFYMSFKAYKGRLFLLGMNDLSIGSLSNWADRLLALMESGDFIAALRLATEYYTGRGERVTIGLPDEDDKRHSLVQAKLEEMILASLRYAFGRNEQADSGQLEKPQLAELADVCIAACISMDNQDFLFDEVFNWYDDHGMAPPFLDAIEPCIVSGEIRSFPPPAVKALIEHYLTNHSVSGLEDIICLLDTSTMDIDQVTSLCKRHNLYDAYIYVWTKTLEDFVDPLEELLAMTSSTSTNGFTEATIRQHTLAMKCFPYLSYTLTGRQYPNEADLPEDLAVKAKAQVYTYLFSGKSKSTAAKSSRQGKDDSPPFPHLRSILSLDAANFMSVLNEAFEDSFLNDTAEQISSGSATPMRSQSPIYNQAVNRQFIVTILLEVMIPPSFSPEETIFLDMFLARNLPKYPQYVLLSGSTLHQILIRLCHYPSEDMADDCQLSVEYLLSVYHPTDLRALITTFEEAGFYRVLKQTYKAEQMYPQLIEAYFKDVDDQDEVFDAIQILLVPGSELNEKQRLEVQDTISKQASNLLTIDVQRTAITIARLLPDLHSNFLESLDDDTQSQFDYLRTLAEPSDKRVGAESQLPAALLERYVKLMCQHDPHHVSEYVDKLRASDLHVDQVLPALETSGLVDAAVMLLARQGQVVDAMEKLKKQLEILESALVGIMESIDEAPDVDNTDEAIHDLMESLSKYTKVGIWLCHRQTSAMPKAKSVPRANRRSVRDGQALSFEESLWLGLVNSVVMIARNILPNAEAASIDHRAMHANHSPVADGLRSLVQQVFTALLVATTAARDGPTDRLDFSFLRILRAFLTDAAATSPSLSQLRAVIASIFSAYAYEESLLSLANEMLNKDLFVHVDEVAKLRQRGWRPRGQTCEICRRRVWGPGAGGQIWDAWRKRRTLEIKQLQRKANETSTKAGKGKAIDNAREDDEDDNDNNDNNAEENRARNCKQQQQSGEMTSGSTPSVPGGSAEPKSDRQPPVVGPVILFACRHLYHQSCLQKRKSEGEKEQEDEEDAQQRQEGSGAAGAGGGVDGRGSGNRHIRSMRDDEQHGFTCPLCT